MIWRAQYKCRLCGKIYCGGAVIGNKDTARNVVWINTGLASLDMPMCPKPQNTHHCRGGSFGVADFIGMKAEKEKDNE